MQLLLLLLVLGIFLHDGLPEVGPAEVALPGWLVWGLWLGPKVGLGALYWWMCVWTHRRLGGPGAERAMRGLEAWSGGYRGVAVVLYVMDLWLGVLVWLRGWMGDLVLLDELAFMLPTLGLLGFAWWAYYPVERRLREAALMGRIDSGLAVFPIVGRWSYVLSQLRHQMALVLLPLLAILGWLETVDRMGPVGWAWTGHDLRPVVHLAGVAVVFVLTPLVIRHVWDTAPLPAGELRERLVGMCRRHGVGVRELLLWRTFGGMINAAVMGLVAPVRYILLTDALLELVRRDQIEAVMAHELAHVKRHHMFWLLVSAIGALGLLEVVFALTFTGLGALVPGDSEGAGATAMAGWMGGLEAAGDWLRSPQGVLVLTVGATVGTWVAVFGWVSRRVERQADAFAVQHLATQQEDPWRDGQGRVLVDAASAQTMIGALQQVADLNHIPPAKRSWRHGSIRWRQAYLRSLVGQPVDRLSVDRQMRWVKVGAVAAVVAVSGFYAWAGGVI